MRHADVLLQLGRWLARGAYVEMRKMRRNGDKAQARLRRDYTKISVQSNCTRCSLWNRWFRRKLIFFGLSRSKTNFLRIARMAGVNEIDFIRIVMNVGTLLSRKMPFKRKSICTPYYVYVFFPLDCSYPWTHEFAYSWFRGSRVP